MNLYNKIDKIIERIEKTFEITDLYFSKDDLKLISKQIHRLKEYDALIQLSLEISYKSLTYYRILYEKLKKIHLNKTN